MSNFVNQNSFLLLAIITWLAAGFVLLRKQRGRREFLILGLVTAILAAGFFYLRPTPIANKPESEILAQIGSGKPVLLEFRSQN